MVLWNGLGQAATVAQLSGLDAGGLIWMIIQAVQTAQRNREECRQLANHVMIISDLLQLLQQPGMMSSPQISRPLDGLKDTLRQAYMLVTSCQRSSTIYRFFMAGNRAQQFRDVRNKIDSYLRIFPLMSHIDTRYFMNRFCRGAQPQASEEALGSFTSNLSADARSEASAFDENESAEVREGTESLSVGQQQEGYGDAELLPSIRNPFRWLVWWVQREASTAQSISRLIGHQGIGFTVFSFSQLAASTNNFSSSNIVGRISHGNVYKGVLSNGVHVAIKTRREDTSGASDFQNELQIVRNLQHANIIKLVGCCIEGDNRIIVYEYMTSGNLSHKIHEVRAGCSLAWPVRFQIIEGIAHGTVYLHQHSRARVVHRDLKPTNILLDHDMTPVITDFGIAEVLNSDEDEKATDAVVGTCGYMDPEYFCTNIISTKSDVYAFGVTLLEIITALPATYGSERQASLVGYAWKLWSLGRAVELIDPSLSDESRIVEILRCIQIALLCVQFNRADRPTMSDVLMMLKFESMTLPVPRPHEDPWSYRVRGWSEDDIETATSTSYTGAVCLTEEEESSSYFS
ncbi:receptor-like serine/threonine-protein kinase SD1-8 isoform X2 [Miscanthus floridulus]|uniref:receptor-like serine/threonine-protein kinase SD1-8 isoform X2 n=1 Tax=Miscanthus floridulus TaxID=154761 RepID=UPI0034587B58